jgi:hypothetical protein
MPSRPGLLFEHDLRANVFGVCRDGKSGARFSGSCPCSFSKQARAKAPGLVFWLGDTLSGALGGLAKEGRCT